MSAARNPVRGYKPAPRARFDAASQHRRSLLAKVHVARKEIGLLEDDYRAVLLRETGASSAKDCTDRQLVELLNVFKSKGWQPKPKKAQNRSADHPAARKARALWISLGHLGVFANPSEAALESFAKRQLKCERLQWADQSQMFKLVEALKAIGEREGWDQSTTGARDADHALKIIKARLLDTILQKLKAAGLADASWGVAGAAVQLCNFVKARSSGPTQWELSELDMLARSFGDLLRVQKGGLA
jgi:phage gp16-like protein